MMSIRVFILYSFPLLNDLLLLILVGKIKILFRFSTSLIGRFLFVAFYRFLFPYRITHGISFFAYFYLLLLKLNNFHEQNFN